MISEEQTEKITKFICDLELNVTNKEKLQEFNYFVYSINIESHCDFVKNIHLEKLLQSLFTCCLNENSKDLELVDDLLKSVSNILYKITQLESDQITEESSKTIKNILQKVIIDLFDNNGYFNCEKSIMSIQASDLCEIKITNQIKLVLVNIMSTLIRTIIAMKWTMSQEFNVVLLLMLHKSNELILHDEHKMDSSTGLSRDTLFVLYQSAVEYFHNTSQNIVAFDYLDLVLFKKKHLSEDVKFFIITILLDHISAFYKTDTDIMETMPCDRNTNSDVRATENSKLSLSNDPDSLQLKSFFRQLKQFSLRGLTNVNQPIRKSALFVLQSLYHLECNKKISKNVTWENFFHVFETLEESQVHLIFPVIDDVDACDNVSLQTILLARMFQNDNVTLLREAIKRLHLLNYDPATIVPLLPIIMKALNNSGLFVPESEAVKKSLILFFASLNKPYTNEKFYLDLLNAIINVPWGPVPLFYVSHYLQLSSCDLEPSFFGAYSKDQHLPKIRSVFKTVTKLLQLNFKHNQIIRSAIDFCLRKHMTLSLIFPLKQRYIVLDDMDLVAVFDNFLNACRSEDKDVYKFHLQDLAQALHFDKTFINRYLKHNFISGNYQIQESSFNMVALFLTLENITPTELLSIITPCLQADSLYLFENIITLNKFAVQYPSPFPLIWCRIQSENPDKGCCFIHSFLAEEYSEEQFKVHLLHILENQNHEKYKYDLEFLLKHGKVARQVIKNLLSDPSLDFAEKKYGYFQTEYNYLFVFNLFYNSYGSDDYFLENEKQLRALFNKEIFFNCENRKSVEMKLRMFLRLCQGREGDEILLDLFIYSRLCIDCLSNTNRDVLPVVLEIMEILIFFCLQKHYKTRSAEIIEVCVDFIRASYQEVKNSKKTTSFRSNTRAWIFSVYPIMNYKDFHDVFLECIDDILEHDECSYRLFKTMFRSVCYANRISVDYESLLLRLLPKGLVYGDLLKKDILVEQTVCEFIRQNRMGKLYTNQFHYSCRVRLKCTLSMVYHAGVGKNKHWSIQLLENLKEIFDSKQARIQYFHNSLTHRIKQRALQNILLLDHIISDSKVKQDLFLWALDSILNYNHQPSIRYFLEWLVIRNLAKLDLSQPFWTFFDRAYDERPGSIVSFLCVIFHVVKRIVTSIGPHTESQVSLVDTGLERITLCSMSQLFNLRLYANVVFIKLYEAMGPRQGPHLWTGLIEKYALVYNAMIRTKSGAKGNAIMNAEKLTSDFYFTHFHPFDQLSLETIFVDLPRLADIAPDEWSPWVDFLDEPCLKIVTEVVRVKNDQGWSLGAVAQPEWIVNCHGRQEEAPSATSQSQGPSTTSVVSQKKFIPMKAPFTRDEHSESARVPRSELIVVTSLIDKIPNIGGLSRSCEVFGATLVVDSLDVVRDAEFKALSMTSEKHVNIVEVKRHNLKSYLMEMRRDRGYRIIGAEQTTNSVKLQDFKYPKKSILVLGNEKDGIRSDILVLLDIPVEIPQLGVLRSLNVHVTGAMFIWEYVKQHCLDV